MSPPAKVTSSEASQRYRERHPERVKASQAKWYATHREQALAAAAKNRQENLEQRRHSDREYKRLHRPFPEHDAWHGMIQRCHNPNYKDFSRYGGRGIKVCERWRTSFKDFLTDMGARPGFGYSVDREDNDGDYEPGNCRWATLKQQANNKINNIFVAFRGQRMTVAAACDLAGVRRGLVYSRIHKGWNIDQAITTPPGGFQ